jgi:acyl-CoA thioester hydrolase
MNTKIFEYPITILQSDIDEQGHVNNIIYLKWVQEAAIAHWISVANTQMLEDNLWVVSRHEIDNLKSAYFDSK